MKIFYPIIFAISLFGGSHFTAVALEARAFSRDATLDYHIGGEGRIGLRAEEIYSFLERVPAGSLKLDDVLQSAPGRHPDRITVHLIRAGERSLLRASATNTTLEIEHPALQRGDVVHLAADYVPRTSPPGHPLMVARAFSPHERWTEARLSFAGPGLRQLGLSVEGFQKIAANAREEERQVWIYRAGAPDLPESQSVHAYEYAARFTLSEVPSWSALGNLYRPAFEPPAEQLDALQQLARHIAPDSATPLEKASAIAAFLASEFRIVEEKPGVVIWPPQPHGGLAALRKGSRFDAARLGHALLAARGLAAEPVLSNARPLFTRPSMPVAGFDAAFLVLKSLGKVINPAMDSGLLSESPSRFSGKFALRLAANGAEPVALAMPDINADHVRIVAELSLSPKGQLSGLTRTEATGASGVMLARHIESLAKLDQPNLVRRLLSLQNLDGNVELLPLRQEADGKVTAEHSFTILSQAHRQNMLRLPLSAGPRLIRPPQNPYLAAIQQAATQPIVCRPQRFEQEIVIHLPYAKAITDLKNDQQISLQHASYRAEYRLETAQRLHIRRDLMISPPGPTCSKSFIDEIAPVIRAAARDMDRAVSISAEGF